MTREQKQLLFDNTARAINGASQEVLERHVENCRRADPAYGDGVARALKLNALVFERANKVMEPEEYTKLRSDGPNRPKPSRKRATNSIHIPE
jgi:hypothetical protein